MSAIVTRETRTTYRTPGGKPFFSRRAAFSRHAWDLIRGKHFRGGEACTCSESERDEYGRVIIDDRCWYHERSGYRESSREATPVEKLHHRLTRWLMWRDKLFCSLHDDCREHPEMGRACAAQPKRRPTSATKETP